MTERYKMKVLLLVQKEQRVILDAWYEAIADSFTECQVEWLTSEQQDNLKAYFRSFDVGSYDRIVLFLRFKKELKQIRFIRTLPNLVVLEHDAYQNYIACKYRGKFSRYYRAMPWVRVLSSGYGVVQKLQAEGFDARFVPKGYDQQRLWNDGRERDIELGFLGSTGSKMYAQRKEILQALQDQEGMLVTRTDSGDDYRQMLNRIRIFVGADIGFGEYMIKNFEAMACGCLLMTWDQGDAENEVLGFKDMENVVLYRSLTEARKKLQQLRSNPEQVAAIAANGQAFAEQYHPWGVLGCRAADEIAKPLRGRKVRQFLGFTRYAPI